MAGRIVKSLYLESCIPGLALRNGAGMNHESRVRWYGDDDSGRDIPAGVYFAQFEDGDLKVVEKIVKLD